jgi:short-subunit dehydrogenase
MFNGSVVVVTGSSRGIGKAIALAFAKEGAFIVLNGRNSERLSETLEELKHVSANVVAVNADVSTEEGAKALIEVALESFGKITYLINNVGISSRGNLGELDPKVIKAIFESNVYGTIFPTMMALPALRAEKGGVLFISSLAGIRGLPGLGPYSASKMTLRALVESIRLEEKNNGVYAGLLLVGITEVAHDKEVIGPDGKPRLLSPRSGKGVSSMTTVSEAALHMIRKRKFIKTLTFIGKINQFLNKLSPGLVEWIIQKNMAKFDERSK